VPKELQKTFSIREFRHGVQALKGLVTTHHDGFMTLGWRPEIHKLFDHSGFGLGMRLTSAWTVLPTAVIEGILDTIRNNVLTFTMQLEAVGINPGQDEEIRAVDENTSGKISQIFNQTIYGSVSNIGRADSVSTSSHVVLRNLQSLNAALQEAGVEEGDIKGLNTALAGDEKEGKPPRFPLLFSSALSLSAALYSSSFAANSQVSFLSERPVQNLGSCSG
jgi:hypothetical protein